MARNAEDRRAQIARDVPALASELAEVVIDPPDRLFRDAATIELDGREIKVRYLGRGHTDHDIIVSVPDADVIFAGDLVEGGAVPYFNDGYPLDWPATVRALADLVTGTIVPGHGDHAGREFAIAQAQAIAAIADLAGRVRGGEIRFEEALTLTPFPLFPVDDIRAPLERAIAQLDGGLG
jgi:glyoxylase-like metal-dependent hydrolase (beta-lactamase superfamily II)